MRRQLHVAALAALVAVCIAPVKADAQTALTPIDAARVNDAIAGGWLGAIVAAPWGYPVEYDYCGRIMPAKKVPKYRVSYTNKFTYGGHGAGKNLRSGADETYMEIPMIEALRKYGLQADWPQLAEPYGATQFPLFFANYAGRQNIRNGVLPPASGMHAHTDDIDFQIESDFIGMATPAQPGAAVDLAWRLGHLMNSGDGVYGGVMVSAMHAAAFRANSLDEIIAAGQASVPQGSKYRSMIDDVIAWHALYPRNWQKTWRLIQQKYARPSHPHPQEVRGFNISAVVNGSYILLGLLYGNGSFDKTVRISMRAGQDTDNNPANAASILGTWVGLKRLPKRFIKGVAYNKRISGTDYTLARAIAENRELAAKVTTMHGGVAGAGGWQIPADPVQPPAFEQRVPGDSPPAIGTPIVETNGRTARLRLDGAAGLGDVYWSFGDLSAAHGADVSHTYLQPGSYHVNLWAASAAGTTTHKELTVTVQ